MPIFAKRTPIQWLSAYLPALLWAALIFAFSSQTTLPGPDTLAFDFIFKKCAHVFVYFTLYFLFYRAFALTLSRSNKEYPLRFWLLPFVICFAYALSDEFHQAFVAGRTSTLRDVGYDMLGASSAFLLIHRYLL